MHLLVTWLPETPSIHSLNSTWVVGPANVFWEAKSDDCATSSTVALVGASQLSQSPKSVMKSYKSPPPLHSAKLLTSPMNAVRSALVISPSAE